MDNEKRVSGLLEMASQHMKRFREVEEIEWKINFSIWALLGGLAYLWATVRMTLPLWLKSPCAFLLAPIPALVPHFVASFMLHKLKQTEAKYRNYYRDQAEELLGNVIPKEKFQYVWGLRGRDWIWISWELFVTFLLCAAVLFLMQTTTANPK
jgi:hypothetical protein